MGSDNLGPASLTQEVTAGTGAATGDLLDAPFKRVAILGVPNSGKSTLFQQLTRKFTASANYPYTTLRLEERHTKLGGETVVLIDTPGITGMELCSEDEAPTRALLGSHPPDVIVQTVDAGNLLRSLILTAQLADLEIPTVICLNMVDEALSKGAVVDVDLLSQETGVPVVAYCAADGRGTRRLVRAIASATRPTPVSYPRYLEEKLDALSSPASRATGIQSILSAASAVAERGQSLPHAVLEAHRDWAKRVAEKVTRKTGLELAQSSWDVLATMALHPIGAWAFLLLTGAAVYFLVAKVGVGILAAAMERWIAAPTVSWVSAWAGTGVLGEILVGPYGVLSLGLLNALCTVLPILTVFYLLFGLLEDIGYFPLLAVQFDRLLRFTGLTGKAVLPITLGFGCNSVATLATRCLETPRQRFIACFLIALGIPCAVQLGVIVAILSAAPIALPVGLALIVIGVQLVAGMTLSRILPRCERGEFLVELPPLRRPRWRNVVAKTYHRVADFFTEACPLFVASAVLLLALHFVGLLDRIRGLMAPVVVQGLGLPREFAETLLMTLARREVGAVMLKDLADRGALSLKQTFVALVVMTLFVPCMSNTLIMGKVVGWRRTAVILVAVAILSVSVGAVINLVWT
jgi:ferrous iron transport protein B